MGVGMYTVDAGIERRLERRKYVVLRFLSLEPETLGRLKFIIGGDNELIEIALHTLLQEGKVHCRRHGIYAVSNAMEFANSKGAR